MEKIFNSVMPTLRYQNVQQAIDFLINAFGFTEHMIARDPVQKIVHAQLTHGAGMVMLGPAGDSDFDTLQVPPATLGGPVTQSAYVVVDDADLHCQHAVSVGAKIAEPLQSPPHGGRFYSCFDIEGHLWNFGTYDPYEPL